MEVNLLMVDYKKQEKKCKKKKDKFRPRRNQSLHPAILLSFIYTQGNMRPDRSKKFPRAQWWHHIAASPCHTRSLTPAAAC